MNQKSISIVKGRIASIELFRFILAMFVTFLHFESLTGIKDRYFDKCFIAVEFFLIITGFFMMSSISKKQSPIKPLESITNSFSKAKSLYPTYLTAMIFTFFINIFIAAQVGSLKGACERLFHFKWEFVYLHMLGFNQAPKFNLDYLAGPAWYLSAMFIALIPLYQIARKWKNSYSDIIAPIVAVIIYFYFIQSYGTLDVGNEILPFAMTGILRAIAGISIGAFAYSIYQKILSIKTKQEVYLKSRIVQAICMALMIILPLYGSQTSDSDVIVYVFVFAAFIISSNLAVKEDKKETKFTIVCAYLGKLSIYAYLFHWGILLTLKNKLSLGSSITDYLLYFAIVIIGSTLAMIIIESIKKLIVRKKVTE